MMSCCLVPCYWSKGQISVAERGIYLRKKFDTPLTPGVTISKMSCKDKYKFGRIPSNAGNSEV